MKRVKVVLWCAASKRSTPGRTWLLSHPTTTESSFRISLLSYRTECVAFLTPKPQLLTTTSSSFIFTHLPLWLRYQCLLPSTSYWTVILASQRLSRSPWQPLPGKVFKPQTTAGWCHTWLFMFPGSAAMAEYSRWEFTSPPWLGGFSVMWRQARSGAPHRINTL